MDHAAHMIQDGADALRHALMESRQRWRQFGAIAADLVFETDTLGHLTFLAPERILGWPANTLLGRPAATLLSDPSGPDPFRATSPLHRHHAWLRGEAGAAVCMALTIVPMLDEAGRHRGVRGTGVNVTAQAEEATATASALRRGEVLDHILARMRQEVLAPRMMQAVLEAFMRALGCPGVTVVDLSGTRDDSPTVHAPALHAVGAPGPALDGIHAALAQDSAATHAAILPDGTPLLASPLSTRFGGRAALVAWRRPGGRPWDADETTLAGSVGGLVRLVLEHEAIQRELARQARTDPLTGLLNRRAFIEETTRRLDRLEREGLPGTLLFIDLDRLKQLNDEHGHEAGDAALQLASALLQRTFRPTDLVARLGGDEFAVWLDGADSLTAAERAEALRLAAPAEFAHLTPGAVLGVTMSIGIATRSAGCDETLDQVMFRADQAMYEVKRRGKGHWHVSHPGRT